MEFNSFINFLYLLVPVLRVTVVSWSLRVTPWMGHQLIPEAHSDKQQIHPPIDTYSQLRVYNLPHMHVFGQ